MKKINIFIVCSILVVLILTGCADDRSKEERIRVENAKKEAIPIIHEHFKSKYGIDVELESVFAEFSGCSHDTDRCYTGNLSATVLYNDSTFYADVENQIIYDNYQAKEIEQACLTYALDELDLSQPIFYNISSHYRNKNYSGVPLMNEYFDGTNAEKIFNMISPDFVLVYENDAVIDSAFPEKLTALFEQTTYDEQSMEYIVLKKGSAEKISSMRWLSDDPAEYYAPYVEYSAKYIKNESIKPEIHQYETAPLSKDLPILKEFLLLREDFGIDDDLVIRQEEPPKGWDTGRKFEQITPSYHFLWNEDDWHFYSIFIPKTVWSDFFETYDEVYLLKYKEYKNGEVDYIKHEMDPNSTENSGIALFGEYFSFSVTDDDAYITFFGIRK